MIFDKKEFYVVDSSYHKEATNYFKSILSPNAKFYVFLMIWNDAIRFLKILKILK
jgi:hypothetical protein